MNKTSLVCLIAVSALAACTTARETGGSTIATTTLLQADGEVAGKATISRQGNALTLSVTAQGITPGPHGIHLHMIGDCSAAGFTSAGGHLNPGKHQHGLQNPAGSHLGDLPNIVIGADGTGSLDTVLTGSAADLEPILFDSDGTAVVIHAAPDDNLTDPSGNSGARIACGVLAHS
ncbi:superoxide dismutase family protein [Novosphingobium sp.]|uniref:superoxide dismutase family protein n=1 Tax=Novosphingobium sp. TaxID=1874826 RepID=UPI0035AFAFBC